MQYIIILFSLILAIALSRSKAQRKEETKCGISVVSSFPRFPFFWEDWLWLWLKEAIPKFKEPTPHQPAIPPAAKKTHMLTSLIASIWTAKEGIQISMETINKTKQIGSHVMKSMSFLLKQWFIVCI